MDVFQAATMLFPMKGHTHGPLDGVGGHAVTRTSHSTFNSSEELVAVYDEFIKQASFERGTFLQGCWKHDESADWTQWSNEMPLQFTKHTGPLAPHGFRFITWKHVKEKEVKAASYDATDPALGDIMLLIYANMSDELPFQMIRLLRP